jgi:branched-chain amino acid transport system permease protein
MTSICVTVLVTLAITIIFKTSYTTNFAQGVISAFGAYVAATCFNAAGINIWVAVPMGALASFVLAVCVDVFIFRRGRNVNALGKQIITMGLISILVGAIPLIFGAETPSFSRFVDGTLIFQVGSGEVSITNNSLVCLAITIVVVCLIFFLLRYSKWGLSVRSTASNEYVAAMMGINTHVVTAISWGLAGFLGALAACMNASLTSIGVYFMTNFQVNAFLAGILGGFATFYGPVFAAILIPFAESLVIWFGNVCGIPISSWSKVIIYAIALLIIFLKPQGLFGKKTVKKV